MNDHLLLKWGTIKGWNVVGNEKAIEALRRWSEGGVSAGAMTHHDSDEQKQAIYDLIDAVDGEIQNDWTGETYTKEQAKEYIRDYRS